MLTLGLIKDLGFRTKDLGFIKYLSSDHGDKA